MTGDAARVGDKHICGLSTGSDPHLKGEIFAGDESVLVGGYPAARVGDLAPCAQKYPNTIVTGSADVLMSGAAAARRHDRTAHAGVITYGHHNVLINAGSFDAVTAAINRIEASAYGQTPEGKALIAKLRKLHADGKIKIAPPGQRPDALADTDPITDEITIYTLEPPDIDGLSNELVHEGTHAQNNERQRNGEYIDPVQEEKSAWDAQDEYYQEQKKQSQYKHHPGNELYSQAEDKEQFLKDNHPEEYWDANEDTWKKYREKNGSD